MALTSALNSIPGQPLWIIFSLIFGGLAIFHFLQSNKSIKKPENKAKVKTINGVNLGINEFINDFGTYIDDLNKQNRIVNILTAIGYFIAFLTSLDSYRLSLNT